MQELLREKTALVFNRLYAHSVAAENILVNIPPKEFPCDFTVVIFPLAKLAGKSPDQIAGEIGIELKNEIPSLDSFSVVKGFLNITFTDRHWKQFFDIQKNNAGYGTFPSTNKKVMIEYCGPNTNKPLHLGHLRNIFIGYSMANILKAAGHDVIKVNIYNDRGVHICKSMLAYEKFSDFETPESSGEKGDHLVGEYYVRFDQELRKEIEELKLQGVSEDDAKKNAPLVQEVKEMLLKWENNDTEVRNLWAMMNGWVYNGFEETYRTLGVDFDKAYYESQTYLLGKSFVEEGIEKKVFYRKEDGSAWVDLTAEGLDQKLLLRGDGTSVYITQDIATANERWKDFGCERMIYTIANEQEYHMKVLHLVCRKLNLPFAEGIYHLSYGMVDLPSGRMKSREGTVVDADDLIEEMIATAEQYTMASGKLDGFSHQEQKELYHTLGLGSLKFFILKVDPKKKMIFNPEESIDFHGFTGPFIQYTHARIKSVLWKAEFSITETDAIVTDDLFEKPEKGERSLILNLQRYPAIVLESAQNYDPAVLANYLFHLAKDYNHFYQELPILNANSKTVRRFRLELSFFVAEVLKKGMKLLGIDVPERM